MTEETPKHGVKESSNITDDRYTFIFLHLGHTPTTTVPEIRARLLIVDKRRGLVKIDVHQNRNAMP